MVIEIPDGIHRSLGEKLLKKKVKIVEMIHEDSADLTTKRVVYRISLTGKDEKGKKKDRISAFVVKGYESAIILQLGKVIGNLPEGIYEIEDKFQYTGTEIIWIDNTEFVTKWGMGDLYLRDSIKIGIFGSLLLKIIDPMKFVLNVVSNKQIVEKEQVDDFIFTYVVQTYREILQEFSIDEIDKNRTKIQESVRARLYDLLNHWGFDVINLEIEGYKFPEGYDDMGRIAMNLKVQEQEKAHTIEHMKSQVEILQTKKGLDRQKRELMASERSFERQQKVLDAKTGYETAKFESAAQQIQGNVNIDLLEKQEVAKVAGDLKKFGARSERDVKIAEIRANESGKIAEAIIRIDEKDRERGKERKNEIKTEIAILKEKLIEFDNMLRDQIILEDTYRMRVDMIKKDIMKLELELKNYD